MQVITEIELLQRIDGFLERHAMAPTTFGRKATGEPQLIDSIRKGRSPSLKVVNRVVAFMDEQDAEARAAQFCTVPPASAPPPGGDSEDDQLPFGQAPVSPTGDISPTSSSTSEPPTSSEASGSCPDCSTMDLAGELREHSCSPPSKAA